MISLNRAFVGMFFTLAFAIPASARSFLVYRIEKFPSTIHQLEVQDNGDVRAFVSVNGGKLEFKGVVTKLTNDLLTNLYFDTRHLPVSGELKDIACHDGPDATTGQSPTTSILLPRKTPQGVVKYSTVIKQYEGCFSADRHFTVPVSPGSADLSLNPLGVEMSQVLSLLDSTYQLTLGASQFVESDPVTEGNDGPLTP